MRRCTAEDVPWLIEFALRKYGDKIKDRPGMATWVQATVARAAGVFVARTDEAAIICALQPLFYDPRPPCRLLFLANDALGPWQMLKLCRAAIDWANQNNCSRFDIRPELSVDFGPLAKRLGLALYCPGYMIEL